MFPNAKFLLMVRDGRAVVHSIISRKVHCPSCVLRGRLSARLSAVECAA